jgi:cytochrome c peroxidase
LFWDGRFRDLESLVVHPVQDTNEMGNNWNTLLEQIRAHPQYPVLYRRAFGIDSVGGIDQELTARALAQYLRTLISGNSRYDRYKAGEIRLTASEDRGRRIFFDIEDGVPTSECGHCHVEPLFSGMEYFNNGLDEIYEPTEFPDAGKGGISGRVGEMGTFRTPSLRNVALTAPYMHDGRFKTLEAVIEHYASGGRYGENVHPNVRPLELSGQDKADLVAFLKTLTDETYLKATD